MKGETTAILLLAALLLTGCGSDAQPAVQVNTTAPAETAVLAETTVPAETTAAAETTAPAENAALTQEAEAYAIRNGGRSPRAAKNFVTGLLAQKYGEE